MFISAYHVACCYRLFQLMLVVCTHVLLQTGSVFSFAAGIVLVAHGNISSVSSFGVAPSYGALNVKLVQVGTNHACLFWSFCKLSGALLTELPRKSTIINFLLSHFLLVSADDLKTQVRGLQQCHKGNF